MLFVTCSSILIIQRIDNVESLARACGHPVSIDACFLDEEAWSWRVEAENVITPGYALTGGPCSFTVGGDHRVRRRHEGGVEESECATEDDAPEQEMEAAA